jgi:hypothetical protein
VPLMIVWHGVAVCVREVKVAPFEGSMGSKGVPLGAPWLLSLFFGRSEGGENKRAFFGLR